MWVAAKVRVERLSPEVDYLVGVLSLCFEFDCFLTGKNDLAIEFFTL